VVKYARERSELSYSLGAQQKTIACAAEARTGEPEFISASGKKLLLYIFGEAMKERERKQKARHGDGFCATEYFHRRSAYFERRVEVLKRDNYWGP
jgi:hypothetical protein